MFFLITVNTQILSIMLKSHCVFVSNEGNFQEKVSVCRHIIK